MNPVTARRYTVHAQWEPRPETPVQIVDRFLKMVDRLKAIDPVFAFWTFGRRKRWHLETAPDALLAEVRAGVTRIADDKILWSHGYYFGAITRGQPRSRSFAVLVGAGGRRNGWLLPNRVMLSTGGRVVPDPASITYALTRELVLTIADVWEAAFCESYPHGLLDHPHGLLDQPSTGYLRPNWMTYLRSDLAARIGRPSGLPLIETTADGGLLLGSATETFDLENPDHIEAAVRLSDMLAPLNALFPAGFDVANADYEDLSSDDVYSEEK